MGTMEAYARSRAVSAATRCRESVAAFFKVGTPSGYATLQEAVSFTLRRFPGDHGRGMVLGALGRAYADLRDATRIVRHCAENRRRMARG